MLHCAFEDGHPASLRHLTATAIGEKEGKILMIVRADHLVQGGKYGLPGGFLDRDETVMEGVQRETLEETGYMCTPQQLFLISDDPYRGNEDRQNVDLVYLVDIGDKVGEPDSETKAVEWVDLTDLPDKASIAFDHFEIIQKYIAWRQKKDPLPIPGPSLQRI